VVPGQDSEHVAIVYNTTMTNKDGATIRTASMEIFRVVDGRIAEVWNCGRKEGRWE
jgi:predicted SnoaL-like aldol condensation-catalyzing enzyme